MDADGASHGISWRIQRRGKAICSVDPSRDAARTQKRNEWNKCDQWHERIEWNQWSQRNQRNAWGERQQWHEWDQWNERHQWDQRRQRHAWHEWHDEGTGQWNAQRSHERDAKRHDERHAERDAKRIHAGIWQPASRRLGSVETDAAEHGSISERR